MDFLDEIIKAAMRDGEFNDLPGAGRPLKLDDDRHTPEHLRLAHKILKDNDLAPDWIMQAKAVDAARAGWIAQLRTAHRTLQARRTAAAQSPTPVQARTAVEAAWEAEVAQLTAAAAAVNRQILTFNLKAPHGITHRPLITVAIELARLAGDVGDRDVGGR